MSLALDKLKELLINVKVIEADKFDEVAKEAADAKKDITDVLVEKEIISEIDLGTLIAKHLKVGFADLSKKEIPEDVLNIIPKDVAKRQQAIVFDRDDESIKLAMVDPENKAFQKILLQKVNQKISLFYTTPKGIRSAILQYHTDFQKTFEKLLIEDVGHAITTVAHDPPIRKMVDLLIETAYEEKASDIHIEPQENDVVVRFRIDGVLHQILTLPKNLHNRIVTRIKVASRLRTDEHLAAQDGKMRLMIGQDRLDLRVSIIPIADGEKVVMRLLSSRAKSYSLSDLGVNDKDLLKINKVTKRSFGMVISTGPTGSGKTTSIYSLLKIVNTPEKNVTSIEDPIEYRIKGANQVQVNVKTNLTFANGLRSLLRQDPDYIFVGEIRDNETAGIAINAALTGHLVFSTLHTNTAAAAIPRLFDMEVEPFLVASTVNVVIGQRLVRRICPNCRTSVNVTQQDLEKYFDLETIKKNIIPAGKNKEIRIYKGKGCRACHNTGYSGRIGIYEVLEVNDEIRDLIAAKSDADEIEEAAVKAGMTRMADDGLIKVTKGLTTIEEVLRVTKTEME